MRRLLKRWWFWVLVLIGLAGVHLALFLIVGSEGRVTAKNFFRLRDGMKEQEVVCLLGKPTETVYGGWYSNGTKTTLLFRRRWVGRTGEIEMQCADGRCWNKQFTPAKNGLLDRMLRLLGL
jgi:hypothetical protein